jgi:hypothetical protein
MKIYVFSVTKTFDWENEMTQVIISEKSYWLKNRCCQDWHLKKDKDITAILKELKLEEEMESCFSTILSVEEVKSKLIEHPNFEFDQKFQDFVVQK